MHVPPLRTWMDLEVKATNIRHHIFQNSKTYISVAFQQFASSRYLVYFMTFALPRYICIAFPVILNHVCIRLNNTNMCVSVLITQTDCTTSDQNVSLVQQLYWVCSRKNFVRLARKLFWPLISSYNFTQWAWRIPFGPDDFPGHIEFGESPPNYLFLKIFRAERTYFCPLPYQQQVTTRRMEPFGSWTLWVYSFKHWASQLQMK